jgi:biofilm PGA synthesis protein PgaA
LQDRFAFMLKWTVTMRFGECVNKLGTGKLAMSGFFLACAMPAAHAQSMLKHDSSIHLTTSPTQSGTVSNPGNAAVSDEPLKLDASTQLNPSNLPRTELTRANYDAVIQAARQGQSDLAIKQLRSWHAASPQDKRIVYDLAALLDSSGDYEGALEFAQPILQPDSPAYAVKAIAHAARMKGNPKVAEAAYQMLVKKTPDDGDAHAGLAYVWMADGRVQEARSYLVGHLPPTAAQYQRHDVPVLVALAEVDEQRKEWLLAAEEYEQVLRLEPDFRYALRGRASAFSNAGMPYLAKRLADAHPDVFTADEKFRLENAATAQTIRFGQAQQNADEGRTRYASTDIALATNANVAREFGGKPATQFDRLVALRNRSRMQDVVKLYESLRAENIAVPGYAKFAVADAYMSLQQPEKARDLYLEGLQEAKAQGSGDTFDTQVSLMHAYQEAEQQDQARALVDKLSAQTPKLLYPGIKGLETPNPDHARVQLLSALLNMYNDRLADAEKSLAELRAKAPFNSDSRAAWASLQMAREHPRTAFDEFSLILVDTPTSVDAATSRADVMLSLNRFGEAKNEATRLTTEQPDNSQIQNLVRKISHYDRPVYRIDTVIGHGGANAGAESVVNASLYSAPLTASLGDRYRAFANVMRTSGKTRNGETESLTRFGAGADYRYRDVTAEAGLTTTPDTGVTGATLGLNWNWSDAWQGRASLDTNQIDLPAAAIQDGVKAKAMKLGLTWTLNESRQIGSELAHTEYSDGNDRDALRLDWKERWYANGQYKFDTETNFYTSRNSLTGRNYFNPTRDREFSVTAKNEWLTWRRYQSSFKQRAIVTLGQYAQEGFAQGSVADVHLEHEWNRDDVLGVQYGIGRSFHPYDGGREYRSYLYLSVFGRIK